MRPLPKNKFFRLRGSYLWPVLRSSSGPLVLVPALVPFGPTFGPLPTFGPTLAPSHLIPAYLDDTLTIP